MQEWMTGKVQGALLSHQLGKLNLGRDCSYVPMFVCLLFVSHFSSIINIKSVCVFLSKKRDVDLPSEQQCWKSDQVLFCIQM